MMFDYQKAIDSGYTQDEVLKFLSEKNPNFDINEALNSGYNPSEVAQFLSESQTKQEKPEEKGFLEKGARIAGQFAMGLSESAALPYDLAVAPLASKEAQTVAYRQVIGDDIEQMLEMKWINPKGWTEKDQKILDDLQEQMKNPEMQAQYAQTMDIGVRSLAEKATGLDLNPEGFAEKTANMAGFIKDPKKLAGVFKLGITPKEVIKSILPSVSETARAIGIEGGFEIAEDGGYGPIGKLGAAIVGDLAAGAVTKAGSSVKEFLKNPKQMMAEVAAKFTKSEQNNLQKEIIQSFRENGIQADLGTITNSDLIKMSQARMMQSGLIGKDLEKLKTQMVNEIRESYKKVAQDVGELKYTTNYEVGSIAKDAVKEVLKKDLAEVRSFYKEAEGALKETSTANPSKILQTANRIETNLGKGQLKSEEQKKVLEIIQTLKRDISDSTGKVIYTDVKDLMNNKVALNEMINYEVQGGAKQLLKELVGDIDRAIISHGKENPRFAKEYIKANKRFAEHAKTFRNKEISRLLREEDPSKLLNRMNSIDGIKKLENILKKSPEGKKVLEQLKRKKLEDLFNNSYISNVEGQLKTGTFANALSKSKDKEIAKEILGKRNFERLQKIQKNAGVLNDSAQKFFNASQSGVVAADVAFMSIFINDVFHALSGNPWPFVKKSSFLVGTKGISSLISDPEFLRLVEDVIIKGQKNKPKELFDSILKLKPYAKEYKE